jgi:F-type H+-transporting ATPase subunit epsilon
MADKLFLSLVTPEKEMVVDAEVDQVNIPGFDGDMGILANHAPLLTILRPGRFSYQKGEEEIALVISQGYAEVTDNRVTVLAESAEFVHEVDHDRAETARAAAEKLLEETTLEGEAFKEAQDKLFRALARLETKKTD